MGARPPAPTSVVIDTNVVAAWTFSEPGTVTARRAKALVVDGAVLGVVPSLFWAEFQHVCRSKLYPASGAALSLADVETGYAAARAVGLTEVTGVLSAYRDDAWDLIKTLGLGSYDAYFLALASDLGLYLWTLDTRLKEKVSRSSQHAPRVKLLGVDVLP